MQDKLTEFHQNWQHKLTEFYRDLDLLYAWMDDIYSVECKKDCNFCCERDNIWMLLPELVRINKIATPEKVKTGCPFRTKTGCKVYRHRPLVCRSFGSPHILGKDMNLVSVPVQEGDRNLFGPGICELQDLPSECNVEELNKIYSVYGALTKWGLVTVGSCSDPILQKIQESVCFEMQQKASYSVYAKNGIPTLSKELLRIFEHYDFEGVL